MLKKDKKGKLMLREGKIEFKKISQLFLVTMLIGLFILSSIAAAQAKSDFTTGFYPKESNFSNNYKGYDLAEPIVILYDPINRITNNTAWNIHENLRLIYKNTLIRPVISWETIKYQLKAHGDAIAFIHVFQTNLDGIKVGHEFYSWKFFFSNVMAWSSAHQILAAGNGKQAFDALRQLELPNEDKIHVEKSTEVMDGQIAFNYAIWEVTEILRKRGGKHALASKDLQLTATTYFAKNINDILERNFKPKDKLGTPDPTQDEKFIKEFNEKNPEHIQQIPGTTLPFRIYNLPHAKIGDRVMRTDFSREGEMNDQSAVTDFIFSFLPFNSSLQGTIGNVVDKLLGLLIKQFGNALGIDQSTVDKIIQVIGKMKDILGIFEGGFKPESALKLFIDLLSTQFPFPEEFKPYFNLFVDALPLLRGDVSGLESIINRLFDLLGVDSKIRNIVSEVIGTASDIINSIKKGDNFLDVLVSILTNRLVEPYVTKFVNETLRNTLGITNVTKIVDYIKKINATIQTVVSIVSNIKNINVTELVREQLPYVIKYVFKYLNIANGTKIIDAVEAVLELGLIFLGYSKEPLRPALERVLKYIIPEHILNKINEFENMVKEIAKKVDEAIQEAKKSLSDFKTGIQTVLDNYVPDSVLSSQWKSFIKDLVTFITAIKNEGFEITDDLPTIDTLLEQLLTLLHDAYPDFKGLSIYNKIKTTIKTIHRSITGVLAIITDEDALKRMVFRTVNNFVDKVKNNVTKFVIELIDLAIPKNSITNSTAFKMIKEFADMAMGIYQILKNGWDNPIKTVFQLLTQVLSFSFIRDIVDTEAILKYVKLFKSLYSSVFSIFKKYEEFTFENTANLINELGTFISNKLNSSFWDNYVKPVINLVLKVKGIFDNGIQWIFTQIMSWLTRKIQELIVDLISGLAKALSGGNELLAQAKMKRALQNMGMWKKLENDTRFTDLKYVELKDGKVIDLRTNSVFKLPFQYSGSYNIGIGSMSAFKFSFSLGLDLNFDFDEDKFSQFMTDLIFHANKLFDKPASEILKTILSFFQLIPTFRASMEIGDFGSNNALTQVLLSALGLELSFSGGASIELELFRFQDGAIDFSSFMKVIGWSLKFTISMSRTFTLLDILTGGAGGALNAVGKYIGLDAISIVIGFEIFLEIVKKAATSSGAEQNTFTLKITIFATLNIGIDLIVVGIKFSGTLKIVLTFFQDFASSKPLQIFFDVFLEIKVKIKLLFASIPISFSWNPIHLDLSPQPGEPNESGASGFGLDADMDGLSDDFEQKTLGFDANTNDTDGDGLSDRFEYQFAGTDPGVPDTDNDGLTDYQEIKIFETNPRAPDTDFDGLSDYEEVAIYGTNPFEIDTDGDGLDDHYEINTALDISNVTTSVKEVIIGGKSYNDRTDPLNPDTDNDGLLDGEEGDRGPYYGYEELTNSSNEVNPENGKSSRKSTEPREGARPIIFNYGFTHPLDNDTDDDSYEQLWNGTISPRRLFLRSMTDGEEVHGIWIQFINKYGEPTLNLTRTNPVNPDTDGDTGRPSDFDPKTAPNNKFLNSDGYELSLDPPSDPNDGDSDDDGLIDGLEGTLLPDSNHTHYLNPDTDGDGLGDMQELLLGTDPRSADSDKDMVSDGDEYFIFGTEPFLPDSDYDGLTDGEELFIYHSNPRMKDSDGDGLIDGAEVLDHGTDPMDEDSDDDGLTDYEEVRIYGTDPRVADMDNDGLFDGEELKIYNTDPRNWDTDNDSILYPNATGMPTFPLSDGDEVKIYGTDPTVSDTDKDGITDAWELYLASGLVPQYILADPIQLNPLNNDTDGDNLADGEELVVKNRTSLVYPYIGFFVEYPFGSRPDAVDTDLDGLSDYDEVVIYSTAADNKDTDNDTYWDSWEIQYHLTDPLTNDTDGDGLYDNSETTAFSGSGPPNLVENYNPEFSTNASDPDTDNDGLPDGAEIEQYGRNPLDPDENGNNIPDGYDLDSDSDLLPDAIEWFGIFNETANGGNGSWIIRPTVFEVEGGPFNPDSDHDGLADGLEVFLYNTSPTNWDSDNDTFSDGLEVMLNLDPTDNSTTLEEFNSTMAQFEGNIQLLIPRRKDGTIPSHYMPLMVKTFNGFSAMRVTYQLRELDPRTLEPVSEWSSSQDLMYDPIFDAWRGQRFFKPGIYQMALEVLDENDERHQVIYTLYVDMLPLETTENPEKTMLSFIGFTMVGVLMGALASLGIIVVFNQNILKRNVTSFQRLTNRVKRYRWRKERRNDALNESINASPPQEALSELEEGTP